MLRAAFRYAADAIRRVPPAMEWNTVNTVLMSASSRAAGARRLDRTAVAGRAGAGSAGRGDAAVTPSPGLRGPLEARWGPAHSGCGALHEAEPNVRDRAGRGDAAEGCASDPAHVFRDDGHSGAAPDRPGRTSAFNNKGLEQDQRGVEGRIRCMRGFKSFASAERFCRSHDELRDFLRPRTCHNQLVSARRRRLLHLRHAANVLAILEAA